MSGIIHNISDFGKKRANAYACPTNNLKFDDKCDCTNDQVCEDTVTGAAPTGESVVSVVFDGITYDLTKDIQNLDGSYTFMKAPGAVPVEDMEALKEVIYQITRTKEVDAKVEVSWEADVLTIVHVGACVLASVKLSDDSDLNGTRCCEIAQAIKWQVFGFDAIGPVSYDGSPDEALDNSPYAYTGTAAADAATAAQLQTDVAAALTAAGATATNVNVAVNNVLGGYEISFMIVGDIAPTFGGVEANNCGASEVFNCPPEE